MNPNETLFGGRLIEVTLLDGSTESIRVRQLPLADYEKAFALLADEMALVAIICGKTKDWLMGSEREEVRGEKTPLAPRPSDLSPLVPGVTPESYELLQTAVQEVNAQGFFAWSRRRAQREQDAQTHMMQALATLPPEAIDQITQLGLAAGRKDTLPTSSPKRR